MIPLTVVCVALVAANTALIVLFTRHISRVDEAHRAEVQALLASAVSAAGAMYAPPVRPVRPPEPEEPKLYSEDGLDSFPLTDDKVGTDA